MRRKIKASAIKFFLNRVGVSKKAPMPDLDMPVSDIKEEDISKYLEYYLKTSEIQVKIRIKIILARYFDCGASYRDISDIRMLELAREYRVCVL